MPDDFNDLCGVVDWQGRVLSAEDQRIMREKQEGWKDIAKWWLRARIAMGLCEVFSRLDVFPPPKLQQELAHVMLECISQVPNEKVLSWSKTVADSLNANDPRGGHA